MILKNFWVCQGTAKNVSYISISQGLTEVNGDIFVPMRKNPSNINFKGFALLYFVQVPDQFFSPSGKESFIFCCRISCAFTNQ